ncbi:hypothetical protein D3C86_2220870 [compost metagenome]
MAANQGYQEFEVKYPNQPGYNFLDIDKHLLTREPPLPDSRLHQDLNKVSNG